MGWFWQGVLPFLVLAPAVVLVLCSVWRLTVEAEDDDLLTRVASLVVWLALLGATLRLLAVRC
jgi:hypothetical protein